MSDEKTKNQDVSPDQDPAHDSEHEESLVSDVDSILAEEDPDFLEKIKKITIETAGLDLSIMGQALGLDKKSSWTIFSYLSRPFEFRSNTKAVVIFWVIIVLSVFVGRITWNYKDSLIQQKLFLTSFGEIGSDLKEFNPNSEVEAFYDNPRFAKNLVTISSMHVNLKPSENSGDNPMLAIEVTAEGLSADAIVEIKDREAEFKDMMLRLTEEKSYDELVEAEGKQLLCEQYRDALNSSLTRGQIRRVLLKSFVIKP